MKRVLLLFAAILALSTPSFAYAFESGGIYYNILSADPATVEVTYASSAYNSYSGEVTIPETVENNGTTYTVVVIGANAFYECTGLTKVVYPASIVGVAKNAFEKCYKLTDFYPTGSEGGFVIGENIDSIGFSAFDSCTSITSIAIPATLETMGEAVFEGCTSLTTADLSACKLATLPGSTFAYCTALSNVTLNAAGTMTTISAHAFFHCSALQTITLPEGLKTIDDEAFQYAGLTTVTLPNSCTSLGEVNMAFNMCESLTEILMTGDENGVLKSIDGVIYKDYMASLAGAGYHTTYYSLAAYPCGRTDASYTILSGTTDVDFCAVMDSKSDLTTITIPRTVTSVSRYAFWRWNGNIKRTFYAYMPFTIGYRSFQGKDYDTLHIPVGTKDYFLATAGDTLETYVTIVEDIDNYVDSVKTFDMPFLADDVTTNAFFSLPADIYTTYTDSCDGHEPATKVRSDADAAYYTYIYCSKEDYQHIDSIVKQNLLVPASGFYRLKSNEKKAYVGLEPKKTGGKIQAKYSASEAKTNPSTVIYFDSITADRNAMKYVYSIKILDKYLPTLSAGNTFDYAALGASAGTDTIMMRNMTQENSKTIVPGIVYIRTGEKEGQFLGLKEDTICGRNSNFTSTKWAIVTADTVEVAMNDAGSMYCATIYLPYGVTVKGPEVTVPTNYTKGSNTIHYKTQIEEGAEGYIPAGTPVIMQSASDSDNVVLTPTVSGTSSITNTEAVSGTDQMKMEGVYLATAATSFDETIYVFSKYNDQPCFRKLKESGTLSAFRVYIRKSQFPDLTDGTSSFGLSTDYDDETTGIEELSTVNSQLSTVYDLQGRRLSKAQKGLNIVNGKKVIF